MADNTQLHTDSETNSSTNQEHGIRVSAEQEMLSETDQDDLETALHGMNIPIEDEDKLDDEELDQA